METNKTNLIDRSENIDEGGFKIGKDYYFM